MNRQTILSRRDLIGFATTLTVASAGGLSAVVDTVRGRRAAGTGPSGDGAAAVTEPAERLAFSARLTFPVDVRGGGVVVLNNFGGRSGVNGACRHNGIDIGEVSGGPGRELYACTDSRVFDLQPFEEHREARGNAVLLEDGVGTVYRYHHLDGFAEGLTIGDVVARGELIGFMGMTGNTAWSHLHFEVRRGGRTGPAVDPVPLLPFPIDGVELGPSTSCRE